MPAPLNDGDFDAIEAAVLETEKGRWFLAEFARRNRAADTAEVLGAVGKLERLLHRERRPDIDRIRLDVEEMRDAIERTKAEIAQLKYDDGDGSRVVRATSELDQIVIQTEAATSEILGAAEKLQEIASVLRDGGMAIEICDAVETLVMQIYTACSFQDLTGQRTGKVVQVLHYLESRINAMIDIWGMEVDEVAATVAAAPTLDADVRPDSHLLNGPAIAGDGIGQAEIDELLDGPAIGNEEIDQAQIDELLNEVDEIYFAMPEEAVPPPSPRDRLVHSDDLMALDRALADDLGEVWGEGWPEEALDDGLATRLAEELAAAGEADDVGFDGGDDLLAEAAAAMDLAIETLRDVTGTLSPRPQHDVEDPLEGLSRAERKALFS